MVLHCWITDLALGGPTPSRGGASLSSAEPPQADLFASCESPLGFAPDPAILPSGRALSIGTSLKSPQDMAITCATSA